MKHTEVQIVQILDYLIDNIFVVWTTDFTTNCGVLTGTNCATLLADLFYTPMKQSLFKIY